MKKPTDLGKNRTGIAMSPVDAKRTIQGAAEGSPLGIYEVPEIHALRRSYSHEAPPVGTMPPPASWKGLGKTIVDAVKGDKTTVLLDKLAERMAFERTGVRLYELLLVKHAAASPHSGSPTRAELEEIRADELRHFGMLVKAIRDLGADPTAMTPCADLAGVQGIGLMQTLADPRTTLTQGLQVILAAELIDNDAWALLIELAEAMGKEELVEEMRLAREEELTHLANVRRWITASVLGQAGADEDTRLAGGEAAASAPPH